MTDLTDMLAATATKHGSWWSPQGTDQCCCGMAVDGSSGWMRHLIEMLLSADNALVTVKLAPCDTTWPATDDDPGAAVWNTPFGTVAAFDDGELSIEGDTHPLDQVQAYAVALLAAVQAVQHDATRSPARPAPPIVGDQLDTALGIDPEDPSAQNARLLAEANDALISALIELREHKNLSREAVATAMGVAVAEVVRIESGSHDPRQSTLRRYAHAIGANVSHHVSNFR